MGGLKKGPYSTFWVPKAFMLYFKNKYGIELFVETGTYKGNTSIWASKHFEKVITIEVSPEWYEKTAMRCMKLDIQNIESRFGESVEQLPLVINDPAIFWLDSHWHNETGIYGKNDPCPLLEEIKIISKRSSYSWVFIDDARLIQYPYEPLGGTQKWPSLVPVIKALKNYAVAIFGDAIVGIPKEFESDFREWARMIKGTKEDIL